MHQCPVCPKSFLSPYKLQRHYVIHTGQKPFTCTVCGKAFTQSDHLKTHLQNVHPVRLPAGATHVQDDCLTGNQHLNCDEAAAGSNTLLASSSLASQSDWKRETETHNISFPSSETGNPPKNILCDPVTQTSTSDVMIPQEHVDSAHVDTSVCSGYTCEVCFKSFSSSPQLWIHSATHNKQKQIGSSRESKEHLSSSRSKMTLKHRCPKCLKTFCSPSKLQRHFLIHTGQKPYSCTTCWKTFRQKVHLKSHLSAPNKCSQKVCNNRDSSSQPTSHRTRGNSSVEVENQCKISVQDVNKTGIKSDAVEQPEQLLKTGSWSQNICSDEQEQQHLTHKDLKPFQCLICSRAFRLEVNLIRHVKIHRNQKTLGSSTTEQNSNSEAIKPEPEPDHADFNIIVKPETWSLDNNSPPQDSDFITSSEQQKKTCSERQRMNSLHQCHACLKCFQSVSKLLRHAMTHSGQRPFGCDTCGKRFRQKTHLRVHSRTHLWSRYHKQRSSYINRTSVCIGGFNTRTAADAQVVSVKHLDQTPSIQNPEFDKSLPHNLKKNEIVQKVSKVTKSVQNSGNLQHKCFKCFKSFPSASKLQRHDMIHMGLKPFQCVLCGKAFRQTSHLKAHERTHCDRKPSEPVNQNMRKLKGNGHIYPRIKVRIPRQKTSVNTDGALLNSDGAGPNIKVNNLFKTNSKSNTTCKKRKLHTCQICFKSFAFPYKLSRHLVTHSGIRPYKCTLCSKTFTQRGHLKEHEHRCRQGTKISHHIQDKCISDLNVDVTREQPESRYESVDRYEFTNGDLSRCSEGIQPDWMAVPHVGEENNESENFNQAANNYGCSFPSELAFEINKLIHSENTAPLSHEYEGSAHNVDVTCQPQGVMAVSNSNKLPSDEILVVENQMQPHNSWCEPLTVFECDKCSVSFESVNNLKQHICSVNVQPKKTESAQKHRCDICSKYFVSPSKLKRHYLIHTGQRPFRCDICGKTFTQSAHVTTHRLTH